MKSKVIVGLLMVVSIAYPFVGFGYQTQGFDSYTESADSTANFACTNQCLVALGAKNGNDIIKISNITGEGTIIAGVTDANGKFFPIIQQALSSTQEPKSLSLSLVSPQLKGAGEQIQVSLVFQGKIAGQGSRIELLKMNISDQISLTWKGLRAKEGQTFYGINLRYGQRVFGSPIAVAGYWIIIFGAVILYFKKKLSIRSIIVLSLLVYLVLALRNQQDATATTLTNIKSYTLAEPGSKSYGNLGDFYEYVTKARTAMNIEDGKKHSCNAYYECLQERPFCVHMWTVFMKPCEKVATPQESDYQIYYKKTPASPLGSKLLEFKGSFVYRTKN